MKFTATELAEFERQVAVHPAGSSRTAAAPATSYAALVVQRAALIERPRG